MKNILSWNRCSNLHKMEIDNNEQVIVLFNSFALQEFDVDVLKCFFAKHDEIIKAVYFSDTVSSPVIKKAVEITKKIEFDLIYSFDPKDSEEYGYRYINSLYSKVSGLKSGNKSSDLYFVGENKGRLKILHSIFNEAKRRNLIPSFRILRVEEKDKISDEIVYNRRISYADMLGEIQNVRCILDIVQEGQTGTTLRYYEAVCYNKMLLTNNKSLRKMKYYDSRFIQIFDDYQNIDWEWLLEPKDIDYGYRNDYSPVNFIKQIQSDSRSL